MVFNDEEISLARQLRDAGLDWEPAVGHFVYDEAGLIEVASPFRTGVYFMLDLKHFLRRARTVERLKAAMFWLPLWHQARAISRELGIDDADIASRLTRENALQTGRELPALYGLILEQLAHRGDDWRCRRAGIATRD